MEKRILSKLINIDKVAYKEVNFKSKLLEWSQKNRVRMEFRMLKQEIDKESSSPVFNFQVFLEGVAGETGKGYSKKEAQQLASEATLKRLKREPQFIEAIFAAKTERTKMEEMPTMSVPDTETEQECPRSPKSRLSLWTMTSSTCQTLRPTPANSRVRTSLLLPRRLPSMVTDSSRKGSI